jgi:hypothetical protein
MAAMEASDEGMLSCLEKMEPCLVCKEPTSEEMESEAVDEEVPKEHAALQSVRGLRKQHSGRDLAAERRQKPEERTW